MNTGTVLFVDDDELLLAGIRRTLEREKFATLFAPKVEDALEIISGIQIDLIVVDEKMPGVRGTQLLTKLRTMRPDCMRILLSGHVTLDTALRAINRGEVFRVLLKPCASEELISTVRQGLERRQILRECKRMAEALSSQSTWLAELERDFPGINNIKKDASGRILIDEFEANLAALALKIEDNIF